MVVGAVEVEACQPDCLKLEIALPLVNRVHRLISSLARDVKERL